MSQASQAETKPVVNGLMLVLQDEFAIPYNGTEMSQHCGIIRECIRKEMRLLDQETLAKEQKRSERS